MRAVRIYFHIAGAVLIAALVRPALAQAQTLVYQCNDVTARYRVVEDVNAYGDPVTVPGCANMVAVAQSSIGSSFTLQRQTPANSRDPWAIWQPATLLPEGWALYTVAGWQTLAQLQAASASAPVAAPVAAPVNNATPAPVDAQAPTLIYQCREVAAQYRVVEDVNVYGDPVTVPGCADMVAVPQPGAGSSFTLQRQAPANPGDPWAIWQPASSLPAGWALYTVAGWQTLAQLQAAGAGTPAGTPAVTPVAPPVTAPVNNSLPVPVALRTLNATSQTLTLSWTAASNAARYRIYRNGIAVGTTAGRQATTYVDAGLSPNSMYAYTVSAIDGAGSESVLSAGASGATTPLEEAGGRVLYRFPTSQARWGEFLESRDGSIGFPIYGPNVLNAYDYSTANTSIQGNIATVHRQGRGLRVLGHMNGSGTTLPIETIKSHIDSWFASNPGLDGIFVGDAGYDPRRMTADAFLAYWAEIAAYIHQKGGFAIIHGGTPVDGGYGSPLEGDNNRRLLDYYEVVAVYESYWNDLPSPALYDWMTNGSSANRFRFRYAAFVNGIPGSQLGAITNYFQSRNVGYLYVTNVDHNHSVSDGSLDPRDNPAYWSCVNNLLRLQPASSCGALP